MTILWDGITLHKKKKKKDKIWECICNEQLKAIDFGHLKDVGSKCPKIDQKRCVECKLQMKSLKDN